MLSDAPDFLIPTATSARQLGAARNGYAPNLQQILQHRLEARGDLRKAGEELIAAALDLFHVAACLPTSLGSRGTSGVTPGCCTWALNERFADEAVFGDSDLQNFWWRIRDSNPGHTDYDSAALTS